MWIGFFILLAIVGFVVFRVGRVGKRVDTRPYCARCRHDLEVVTEGKCPECAEEYEKTHLRDAWEAWMA